MREWKDVATLVKTRNLDGRFVAKPAAGLPFVLDVGMQVAFVPPQTDLPRQGVVVHARRDERDAWEVGFDTVDSREVALGLVSCHCLVRCADLPESFAFGEVEGWVGWHVVDASGEVIGDVAGLADNPAHPLLEVDRPGGDGTASIPVVEDFIVSIDEEARKIVVDLPAGLLDL